ncbi:MAG: hypothetical protein UMS36scaffold28_40 [Phage 59_13]|nr:MAG: hypothetical protein UMS36scaffold28_40 [Phage 59_13]
MRAITLSRGKCALVDDDVFEAVGGLKWSAVSTAPSRWYALRRLPTARGAQQMFVYLHHAVAGRPLHKLVVDHIDGNGLNNQRANLRIVTHRENNSNSLPRIKGLTSSRYVGVAWHRSSKYWIACITVGGRNRWLGHYRREVDAARAYQAALRKVAA